MTNDHTKQYEINEIIDNYKYVSIVWTIIWVYTICRIYTFPVWFMFQLFPKVGLRHVVSGVTFLNAPNGVFVESVSQSHLY